MLPSHIVILAFALNQFFIAVSPKLRTNGKPIYIEYFYSHSFITDALKIDYEVQDNTEVYYNITAFRPFPGRLLMNFFVRKYAAIKGEPSTDVYKRRNLDFCKTLDILRNMTSNAMEKPFLLQDTFVTSCPLVNGFYFVQSGIIPSSFIPTYMGPGRYVVHFELIQVIDELVKLMNLRFIMVVDESGRSNPHESSNENSGESSNESANKNEKSNSNEDPDVNWNAENGGKNSNENPNINSNENTNPTTDQGSSENGKENSNENANDKSDRNLSKNSNENPNLNSNENINPTTNNEDSGANEKENSNENPIADTNTNSNENPSNTNLNEDSDPYQTSIEKTNEENGKIVSETEDTNN